MNTSILPKHLQEQAIILSEEPAWSKENVQEVIKFLSINNYAVLGVEIWLAEGNAPRVIGWSQYDIADSENWKEYVDENAKCALATLEKVSDADALYNLIWIDEKD